jgi:tRNA (guanine37-N1)-methyltransferase
MKISIITLFPEMFPSVLNVSIIGRAQKRGILELEYINLREFGEGVHQIVDDRPYGGGVGMVLKADILAKAWKKVTGGSEQATVGDRRQKTILMSASGTPFEQVKARELSKVDHLIIVCGHYEGIDQRFIDHYVDEEMTIGDYVLTGGELPAMVIVDSITRLIPGVLEKEDATLFESFEDGLLEYPHFTRPEEFEGEKVPEVLISGHHGKVEEWRKERSLEKTKKVRPDLLKRND